MLGAIIGDIVGSRFQFIEDFKRSKEFPLFTPSCCITDDSLMTLAIAEALLLSNMAILSKYTASLTMTRLFGGNISTLKEIILP